MSLFVLCSTSPTPTMFRSMPMLSKPHLMSASVFHLEARKSKKLPSELAPHVSTLKSPDQVCKIFQYHHKITQKTKTL